MLCTSYVCAFPSDWVVPGSWQFETRAIFFVFSEDLVPAILDLPGAVVTEICTILDSSAEHGWKRLVEHVPDYSHMDIVELYNLTQQVKPSICEEMYSVHSLFESCFEHV